MAVGVWGGVAGVADGVEEGLEEAGVVPGFGDEIDGSFLEALDGEFDFGVGGEEDDGRCGGDAPDFTEPVEAFVAVGDGGGEVHVEEYAVRGFFAQEGGDARR